MLISEKALIYHHIYISTLKGAIIRLFASFFSSTLTSPQTTKTLSGMMSMSVS